VTWRRIRAYLSNTRADAVCSGGLLSRRKAQLSEPAAGAPVEALGRLLAAAPCGGAKVSLALSCDFVRLVLLPPPARGLSAAELQALALDLLARSFGVDEHWRIRLASLGGTLFAAAVPEALFAALTDAVAAAGGRLAAVRPAAAAALAAIATPRQGAWVAVVEEGSTLVALREAGAWRSVRVSPRGLSHWEQLLSQIERERARLGSELRRLVCVSEAAPPPAAGWELRHSPARFALLA